MVFLPIELWREVLPYTDVRSLCRLLQLSKSMHEASVEDSLWSSHYRRRWCRYSAIASETVLSWRAQFASRFSYEKTLRDCLFAGQAQIRRVNVPQLPMAHTHARVRPFCRRGKHIYCVFHNPELLVLAVFDLQLGSFVLERGFSADEHLDENSIVGPGWVILYRASVYRLWDPWAPGVKMITQNEAHPRFLSEFRDHGDHVQYHCGGRFASCPRVSQGVPSELWVFDLFDKHFMVRFAIPSRILTVCVEGFDILSLSIVVLCQNGTICRWNSESYASEQRASSIHLTGGVVLDMEGQCEVSIPPQYLSVIGVDRLLIWNYVWKVLVVYDSHTGACITSIPTQSLCPIFKFNIECNAPVDSLDIGFPLRRHNGNADLTKGFVMIRYEQYSRMFALDNGLLLYAVDDDTMPFDQFSTVPSMPTVMCLSNDTEVAVCDVASASLKLFGQTEAEPNQKISLFGEVKITYIDDYREDRMIVSDITFDKKYI